MMSDHDGVLLPLPHADSSGLAGASAAAMKGAMRAAGTAQAHNRGWVSTQRSTVSRSLLRSVTRFQPRQSSASQMR